MTHWDLQLSYWLLAQADLIPGQILGGIDEEAGLEVEENHSSQQLKTLMLSADHEQNLETEMSSQLSLLGPNN